MGAAILQVTATAERRGAETFALQLHHELATRGHEVTTVAVRAGTNPELDVDVLGASWPDIHALRRLRDLIRQADVVLAHGSTSLPACSLAAVGLDTPVVYRQISDPTAWSAGWSRRLRVSLYLRRVDTVVALTDRTRSVIADRFSYPASKVRVIPNGVDDDRFQPVRPDQRAGARREFGRSEREFVVAWIGSLSAEKQPELALEVISQMQDAHLLMAGNGPCEDDARKLAGPNVTLLGAVADPARVYQAADVVILTSRTESLPAVVIEAGMCGLPVVASDVGDIGSIIENDSTGILVEPVAPDFVQALESLRRDERRREQIGLAARQHHELIYPMSIIGGQWEEVACSLASGGQSDPRPCGGPNLAGVDRDERAQP